jgi:hypothetical protein
VAVVNIYILVFFVRLGALYFYEILYGKQGPKGHNEVLRIGSDLTLIGFGMSLIMSTDKNFGLGLILPYPLYLAGFVLLFVVNYCLFLSLARDDVPTVFSSKKKLFALSLLIGFIALNLNAWVV